MDYPHQFSAQEEQVLGRLFVEHAKAIDPNVTFFDVFKHLVALDDDLDSEQYTPVRRDDFDGIVAGVASPDVMNFDDGLDYITDYMRHGGKVAHVEEWLGVPLDNALDVLAFGIDDEETEDQETMLSWTQKEWCDIEALLKSARNNDGWTNVWLAEHISDRHNVSEATAHIIPPVMARQRRELPRERTATAQRA